MLIKNFLSFINESYDSQKELEKLSYSIIKTIITNTVNADAYKLYPVFLKDITEEFGVIEDFVSEWKDLEIQPLLSEEYMKLKFVDPDSSAKYIGIKNVNGIKRIIIIKYTNDFIEDIHYYISKYGKDIAINKMMQFKSSHITIDLLHELQHAYDDWRSDGKFSRGDKSSTFRNIEDYLNLPYEVDAKFTEAITKTKFTEIIDLDFDNGGNIYGIRPFDEVFREFMKEMDAHNKLNPIQRKRILRKFGQFYQKEKDALK